MRDMVKTVDKRFGSWSPERRAAHVARMAEWSKARHKAVPDRKVGDEPSTETDETDGCCYCHGPVENSTRYDACEGCREQKGLDGDESDE